MATNETQVFTGEGVTYFRLCSLKQQLKMEEHGLKSSGGPIRPRIAAEFGLKPRAPRAEYIAKIEQMQKEILARQEAEVNKQNQQ